MKYYAKIAALLVLPYLFGVVIARGWFSLLISAIIGLVMGFVWMEVLTRTTR